MTRRVLWGAMAAVATALATAAPAGAALEVTEFSLTPSTTKAGANADVTIVTGFRAYQALQPAPEQAKALVFHLPPGLAGDPFATPQCTEARFRAADCPPASQVGEVAAEATALLLGTVPTATTAAGGVFNLVPEGTEPARLGAVLQPATPGAEPLLVPTLIKARPGDGGLDSVDPRVARDGHGGRRLHPRVHVEDDLHALRQAAGREGAVHAEPDLVRARHHDDGGDGRTRRRARWSGQAAFTPTDCGALPFAPHIEASIGGYGRTGKSSAARHPHRRAPGRR